MHGSVRSSCWSKTKLDIMNLNQYGLSVINGLGCQMQASPLVDGVGGYDLAWQVVDLMLCQPAPALPLNTCSGRRTRGWRQWEQQLTLSTVLTLAAQLSCAPVRYKMPNWAILASKLLYLVQGARHSENSKVPPPTHTHISMTNLWKSMFNKSNLWIANS